MKNLSVAITVINFTIIIFAVVDGNITEGMKKKLIIIKNIHYLLWFVLTGHILAE